MNSKTRNKILIGVVVLLLLGNAATIAVFWMGKSKPAASPKGTPKEFLIKELNLDSIQQQKLEILMLKHREEAPMLRKEIRQAKKAFFNLLKQPGTSDTTIQAAEKSVIFRIEQLDLFTFNHFQQIRQLCTARQQIKFDAIIEQIATMQPPPRQPIEPGSENQKRENTAPFQ
jgi:periplasmic protein CpxP/Spy